MCERCSPTAGDHYRTFGAAPGAGGGGQHDRSASVAHHDDLEQVQRVGDEPARQHVVGCDGAVEEDGVGVGAGTGPLVGSDLCPGPVVGAVEGVIARGIQGEADVRRHVAVGHLELRLGRPVGPARRVDGAGSRLRRGCRRRRPRTARAGHDDDVAEPELDGGRRPPDRGDGRRPSEVDPFGEVDRPAAVLGDGCRVEHGRFRHVTDADQPVDLLRGYSGIGERGGREIGPLVEGEAGRPRVHPLRPVVRHSDDRRPAAQSHVPPPSSPALRQDCRQRGGSQ